MCRDAELRLPPTPDAARIGRHFVRDHCLRWDLDDLAYEATLLVSELVTNSVLHARTPATIRLSVAHQVVEAAVADGDERQPVLRPVRDNLMADLDALDRWEDHVAAADLDARHVSLAVGEAGAVTAGRGLVIVDALADSWGTAHRPVGKAVWFALGVPDNWKWRDECVCVEAPQGSTFSGRPVTHIVGQWDGT